MQKVENIDETPAFAKHMLNLGFKILYDEQ